MKLFSKAIVMGILFAFALSSLLTGKVQAAVVFNSLTTQPVITNTFSVASEQAGDYKDPDNSFNDGSPKYIFVTRDASKAGTTSVNYDGIAYAVTTLVSNGNDLSSLADASGRILRANVTIFFDAGIYNDADSTNYFGFSQQNLSLVGLTAGTVTITRSPDVDSRGNKTMERTGFAASNVYLENLIFDGGSINMVSGSRGESFFFLAGGSSNFVMKNCVIQNVGASSGGISNKNVAMNFYISSGKHNFENVTFKNIKTQLNYGILSFNDSKDNYFKNITITNDGYYGGSTYSVKIENTVTTIAITDIANVFSGTLSLPTDANHNFVYIQDFRYGKTILPTAYRYAQYKNSNGTSSSSAIQVYSALPTVSANRGVLDLSDNAWLVQAANSRTITLQLGDILAVRTGMNNAGALAKWPNPNIKISANSSGEIGSFNVPAFPEAVNIVAVPGATDAFSSTSLIPFSAAGVLSLTSTTTLYNFDFQVKAKYTLAELTQHRGLSYVTLSDPYQDGSISGYPIYSKYGYTAADVAPIFTNASASSFGNCKFISLANEIAITPPASTSLGLGYTLQLNAALKDSDTNSYTGSGFSGTIKDTADDASIGWYSSNPAIASVDANTGLVTANAIGTVTIVAKANDINNQGEIEKPYALQNLTVRAQSHLVTLTGKSSVASAGRGSKVVFTFTITNTGLDPNPNTIFSDTLPAIFSIDDVTPDSGGIVTLGGNTITVDFGTLAAGESVTVVVTATVVSDGSGDVVNNVGSVSAVGGVATSSFSVAVQIIGGESKVVIPIPKTGFAPGSVTTLPLQRRAYSDLGSLWLEIPSLGVKATIVGVPQGSQGWDVSWLGQDIGWLNGSAWPGWNGNSVLTAHNYGADGLPGPFVNLAKLKWGDKILLHALDGVYTYEVHGNLLVGANDSKTVLQHQDLPWLTLVTCSGYDAADGTYHYRQVVQAVLVKKE